MTKQSWQPKLMSVFVRSRPMARALCGIFHHLITLPTYHTAALSTDNLAKEYFGDQGDAWLRGWRAAQGNPSGYCLREAPEHGWLRHG